jgi:hypothetical protein
MDRQFTLAEMEINIRDLKSHIAEADSNMRDHLKMHNTQGEWASVVTKLKKQLAEFEDELRIMRESS